MEENRLKRLEAELTCAICEEHYNDPRLLPCMHYYCKRCVEKLIKSQSTENRCPECRRAFEADNAESLHPAFFVHRLQDVYSWLALEPSAARSPPGAIECGMCSPTSPTAGRAASICWTCKRFVCESCERVHERVRDYQGHHMAHLPGCSVGFAYPIVLPSQRAPELEAKGVRCHKHSKRCKIYCIQCNELLCTLCKVLSHADHKCESISDCISQCKATLQLQLESVRQRRDVVSAALTDFEDRREAISANASTVCKQIMVGFVKLIDGITEARDKALQSVYELEAEKTAFLKSRVKSLEMYMSDLCTTLEDGDRLIAQASDEVYLSQHKYMLDCGGLVLAREHDLRPTVDANIEAEVDESLLNKASESCHVYTLQPDPMQCTLSGPGLEGALSECKNSLTLQLAYSNGKPCTEEQQVDICVHPLEDRAQDRDESQVELVTCSEKPGNYKISYMPHGRGWFHIEVSVNGMGISGSPFRVFVSAHPTDLHSPLRVIDVRTRLDGITINTSDQLVVSEKNRSEVSIWNTDGKKVRVIKIREFLHTKSTLCCPTGVAVDPTGCMYIADNKSHSLFKLSEDGAQCLKSIEGGGSELGQLMSPGGVRISRLGEVYVCDCENHRIQVFDQDLHPSRSFGREGHGDGEFKWPVDIVFDQRDYIYISDMDNHRIQVFDKSEKFVRSFGQKGSDPGYFNRPVFMFLDPSSFLYISENENHRVSVFKTSGEFVTILGGKGTEKGRTMSPKGITMDKHGLLYVCERGNKRIQVF